MVTIIKQTKSFATVLTGICFGIMLSTPAFALWGHSSINMPMPNDPGQLQGAFSGRQYVNGHSRDVTVLIHPAPTMGSLYVVLMDSDQNHQHFEPEIFYAETLEARTDSLVTLGLASNDEQIAPMSSDNQGHMVPSALMNISVDNQNRIQSIDVTPQDGVTFLSGPVHLDSQSSDYRILETIAPGQYELSDPASMTIYVSGTDVLASANVPQLGLSNRYSVDYELTGLAVLRARSYGDYSQQQDSSKISALLIPVVVDGQPGIVVDRPGKGSVVLTAKQ